MPLPPTATDSYERLVGDVIIPQELHGLPITEFADSAFSRCFKITKVIIKAQIETIPFRCFADCFNLIYIEVPPSVKVIKESAIMFYNFTNYGDHASQNSHIILFQRNSKLTQIVKYNFRNALKISLIFETKVIPTVEAPIFSDVQNIDIYCHKPMQILNYKSLTFDPCTVNCIQYGTTSLQFYIYVFIIAFIIE